MHVIGITGGSGSGKSVICRALAAYGYTVIDADKIAREIVAPGQSALVEIVAAFGDVLLPDGTMDRKKVASIVFSDADKLHILNTITHKYIAKEICRRIESCETEGCIIDAPLLYEAGLDAFCALVIGITADRDVRLQRIIKRDTLSVHEAQKRIESQSSIDENLKRADLIVDTTVEIPVHVHAQNIVEYIEGEFH